ncbi:Inosose dehydratase [compost metagenome]
MKLGVSSYSLYQAMQEGSMSILDVVEWIADNGGEHIEIVPLGFDFTSQPELIHKLKEKAYQIGIDISNYAVGANFATDSKEAYEKEIGRVKGEVDIAHQLGASLMRHDVASRPDTSIIHFNRDLASLANACRAVADYASQYQITTSVENHGFYIQASDRVLTLLDTVSRPNFKTTLDVGNFVCVDENPIIAVQKNISHASIVHIKDFYIRQAGYNPGEGWFKSTGGNYLRGAIAGHGDLPLWDILRTIKNSGYGGYLSIEFEGLEDCRTGTRIALDNVRRIWNEV